MPHSRRLQIFSPSCLSLLALLMAGCSSGPRLNVCISDATQFHCQKPSSLFHHPSPTLLAFSASGGYSVYPALSAQAIYNYCAARKVASTQPPVFTACVSDPASGGLDCRAETCSIVTGGGGATCWGTTTASVPFAQTENYLALSPTDNATLFAYCNVVTR